MNGLVLSPNTLIPSGEVLSFALTDGSAQTVSDFFGPSSDEYAYASIYAAGFTNGTQQPASILFALYNSTTATSATLRSGSFANYSLAEMQALTGVLTLTVDGTSFTSSSISLTGVTSQSLMAAAIAAAFTGTGKPTVTWDAVHSEFVFTSTTTGANSTITYATGTLAQNLLVTAASGGVTSQGAALATPSTVMNSVTAVSQNWATMSYLVEPSLADKKLFATWFSESDDKYLATMWDSDANASVSGGTGTFGVWCKTNHVNGVMCIGGDPAVGSLGPLAMNVAAFVQGMVASINYNATNGVINLSGKSANSASVTPTCSSLQTYTNLLANGYNCCGSFASRNFGFTFFSDGNLPGGFPWADEYINQIWLNAQFELTLLNLYTTTNLIPYDSTGYGMIRSALIGQSNSTSSSDNGPINNALNNGVIQTGMTLSSTQAVAVNQAAGKSVSSTIESNGYYLQITDPGAVARQAKQTPIINFWYTYGSGIQKFSMASINIL
jgi:hypothetical protein